MLSRGRVAAVAWSVVAVVLSWGCAAPRGGVAPDASSIAGTWEGEVWEMPTHYLQGARRITLTISRDGAWTATSGGARCASGRLSVRDGLVVLGVERAGPDFCMPYSLASRDGRMKAVFGTSFKARETSAMIDLQRMPEPAPAAAQATRP